MIYSSHSNLNTHLTVKGKTKVSLPVTVLFERNNLKREILDFGCGLGKDVEFFQSKGFSITGYVPHYFPELPKGNFDTIICNYVLNVLLPEEQSHVLMAVSELLKPKGKAFFCSEKGYKEKRLFMQTKT